MEKILFHSSLLSIDLYNVQTIIERLFPDNKIHLLTDENSLWSDGNVFEASVEPYFNYKAGTEFILSGSFQGSSDSFNKFLQAFISECEKFNIVYNLDYQIQTDDKKSMKNIQHPDFVRLTTLEE